MQETAGLVYERLNEMSKAQRAFAAAARLGKQDPNIQNSYAGFLCRTGKAPAGEKTLHGSRAQPGLPDPGGGAAQCRRLRAASGDVVDAERYFNRALAIRPNMPEALLELGQSRARARRCGGSARFCAALSGRESADPRNFWLGYRAERKLGDSTAAAGYARRLQTDFPNSEQAQVLRSGVDR